MAETLVSILNISAARAQQLLREADGQLETAVALHYSTSGPTSSCRNDVAPESPRSQLRAIIGRSSLYRIDELLRRADGSVERAADLYFSQEEAGHGAAQEPVQTTAASLDRESDANRNLLYTTDGNRTSGGRESAGSAGASHREAQPARTIARNDEPARQPPSRQQASFSRPNLHLERPTLPQLQQQPSGAGQAGTSQNIVLASLSPSGNSSMLGSLSASSEDDDQDSDPEGLPVIQKWAAKFGLHLQYLVDGSPAADAEMHSAHRNKYARNTGNQVISARMGSLQSAISRKARSQEKSQLQCEHLPLPRLRNSMQKLFCDDSKQIPAMAKPTKPVQLPLHLSSLQLPLHWVNPHHKTDLSTLVWSSANAGPTCYSFMFKTKGSYFKGAMVESTVLFLSLDKDPISDVAVVMEDSSWVSEFLYNLHFLASKGLISWKLTLQPPLVPGDATAGGQESSKAHAAVPSPDGAAGVQHGVPSKKPVQPCQSGSGVGSETRPRSSPALVPTPAPATAAASSRATASISHVVGEAGAAEAQLPSPGVERRGCHVSGRRPLRSRTPAAAARAAQRRSVFAPEGATTTSPSLLPPGIAPASVQLCNSPPSVKGVQGRPAAAETTPSTGSPGGAGAQQASIQQGKTSQEGQPAASVCRPTHAWVEVFLTNAAKQLWWAEKDCSVARSAHKLRPRPGEKRMQKQVTGVIDKALNRLMTALLTFGEGLTLGPDCDGLLNFNDTSREAWDQLPTPDDPEFRRLFDVKHLLRSLAPGSDLAAAVAPRGLSAHPKHYQLQALQWMMDRERRGDAVGRGLLHLHPEWLQLEAADGQLFYMHRTSPHVLSDVFYTAPVGGTCGGFLCDEMGLGKTLETLMLVLSNRPPPGWAVSSLDDTAARGAEHAVPIKASLIVVPVNLLAQWGEEIKRHLNPGALTWCTYSPGFPFSDHTRAADGEEAPGGPRRVKRRSKRPQELEQQDAQGPEPIWCRAASGRVVAMHEADIVFISYEQLRDELHKADSSPLHQYGFWRVVLDEAQLVANSSSVAAVMASSLWRRHAWVVTGTPITARLDEVKGLLEFLAYEPFYHHLNWAGLVQKEYSARSASGLLSMRALLRGVMLRRSKADVADELHLPPCSREDRWVRLSSVERLVYEQARRGFLDAAYHLHQHQHAGGGRGSHSVRASTRGTGRALQAFTALRQSCCHPQIVRRRDQVLGKERLSMREIMEKLVVKAFNEWDNAARGLLHERALLAVASHEGAEGHPGVVLQPFMEAARAIQQAAWNPDIRDQASRRRMDGSVLPGEHPNPDGVCQPGGGRKRGREEGRGGQAQRDGSAATSAEDLQGAAGAVEGKPGTPTEGGPSSAGSGADVDEAEEERWKEAKSRARGWQKLELDLLELYSYILQQCCQSSKKVGGSKRGGQRGSVRNSAKRARADSAGAGPSNAASPSGRRASQRRKVSRVELDEEGVEGAAGEEGHGSGSEGQVLSREVLEMEIQEAAAAVERLQVELRLREGPEVVRRSKRQAGVDVEEEIVMDLDMHEALQEQLVNAKVILRSYNDIMKKNDPQHTAQVAVNAAGKHAAEAWHHLQHLLHKEAALVASQKGKAAVEEGEEPQEAGEAGGGGERGVHALQQEDLNSCPICLDDLTLRTITACGHHFCPTCIREVLAQGRRSCPICRAGINEWQLFDACTEEEAALKEQAGREAGNMDYGSKVAALLEELAAMQDADPTAKAVVFSSWGRLLGLVGQALQANGVGYASLCGANAQQRQDALHRFLHDPTCVVLAVVMSTSGGAAGLTLTAASTAFLLEPSLNPGLEAQAAARIYRLGQTKPTRVIRLLAEDTIERSVLHIQRRKLENGEDAGEAALQEVDPGVLLQLYEEMK